MKIFCAFLLTCITAAGLLAIPGDSEVTLNGSYVWNASPNKPGNLKAVFKNENNGEWDVAFYFKFNGQDHVYEGKAKGDPDNGSLKGEVKNERRNRTFTFDGKTSNGNFTGEHAELRGKDVIQTGTLKLKK